MPDNNHDDRTTNNELQRDLGRVEGKIDGILAGIAVIQADNVQCNIHRDHLGDRITKIANQQYWFSGAAAAAGFVLAKLSEHLFH